MKKLLLTLVVVLLFAMGVTAQDEAVGLTGKGIKAGLAMANLYGDDVEENSMKLGFGGGAFLTYHFVPQFAIQPEVMFMMKGSKFEEEDIDDDTKINLTYIEIPVLFKFTPQMEGNIKPNIFAGPAIGLLMGAKIKNDAADVDLDVKDGLKSIDFGIQFGAGVEFVMETMKVTVDARYCMGMTKVIDYEEWNKLEIEEFEYTEDPDTKTNNIAIMLGVSF